MSYIVTFVDTDGEDIGVERECVITVKSTGAYNHSCIVLWRGVEVVVKGSVKDTIETLNRANEYMVERSDEEATDPSGADEWKSM